MWPLQVYLSFFFPLQLIATNVEPLHFEFVGLVKKMLNNSDERQQFFQVSIFSIGYIPYRLFALNVKSALIIVSYCHTQLRKE